ncbi:hypothetical protein B0H19DRAFT_1113520 [Mycena capillaripes]|nr:hypothetical protein B0H19DRAFT_1113520 [Mycena capillaripes]
MFTSIVFNSVLASTAILLSQAQDVIPIESGPGEIFNEGTTCHIAWVGSGTTTWNDMTIELMTGSNTAMILLTTVAQHQDGSTAGVFDYPCPEVTPNSPIYFYQFSAPGTSELTWTTRFTIAGADGSSTPAKENDGGVPFGNGQLVGSSPVQDSSSAVGSHISESVAPSSTGTSSISAGLSSKSGDASNSGPGSASISNTSPPSNTGPASASDTSLPTPGIAKKKNLAGPIAGGVIGGLLLLCALGFLVYRAPQRRQTNSPVSGDLDDKGEQHSTPWLSQPLPRTSAPTTELHYEEWTPEPHSALTTLPDGKTQLSLANQVMPHALLAAQEKYAQRQKEMPNITEETTASLPSQSMSASPLQSTSDLPWQSPPASPAQSTAASLPPDADTNAHLVAQIEMLREQMNAMQRQMQPPGYTADNSGPAV